MASTFIRPSDPSAVRLVVCAPIGADCGQWTIENGPGRLADFDKEYVNFGGYFGQHDPHVFAAAPELLIAAQAVVKAATKRALHGRDHVPSMRDEQDALGKLRAAISRATQGDA
ncbi:hypothetical protein [Sphingomonas beigongshangi]|uniref:hypothetical protein n=1 Tax=Sphingomonas beigongshangi TaxID=2782540 RepID=UPI00193C5BE8|nr:hypothetical protein [Sphingomonas beigongshangi]